jgi:hypothetical protein
MLRSLIALTSSLQIGARVRKSLERFFWQAAVVGVAAILLVAALVFGLVAIYGLLVSVYAFSGLEAAAIMALTLALLGLLVLAMLPLSRPGPRRGTAISSNPSAALVTQGVGLVDQGLGAAMQQLGPLPLVAVAFVAGLVASRR